MITIPRSATFTRPADTTTYASGDAVTNSTSAGVAMQFAGAGQFPAIKGNITRAVVQKSTNTTSNTSGVLLLFSADPGAVNDNAAVSLAYAAVSPSYIGAVTIATATVPTGLAYAVSDNTLTTALPITIPSALSGTIYGVFVATAAYAPGSAEVFLVTIYVQPENI